MERKSRFTLMKILSLKRSDLVTASVVDLMKPLEERVCTITADNGKEFAGHEDISEDLRIGFYFAHPYRSWERGVNKNTNGLIRQYFPKGMSFDKVTDEDTWFVMNRLNNRPRKCLGHATPNEIFWGENNVRFEQSN